MKNLHPLLRILLAVVIGEVVLILLSALVQEGIFQGIFWTTSSTADLLLGGFLTFVSAVIPGFLAMWIVMQKTYIPHVILSILICAETTWLIVTKQTPDPVWFDALAGLSLVIGILLGGWLRKYALYDSTRRITSPMRNSSPDK